MFHKGNISMLPVSDLARNIAAERGRLAKQPKVAIERILSGSADNEPLLQSYAKLEEEANRIFAAQLETLNQNISNLATELEATREKYKTAFEEERAFNNFYNSALKNILKRAKGSIFGKGSAIVKMCETAITRVEGTLD